MFSFDRELRFGDCDPAGMAYFPAYLNIMNGVVEEFWIEIGFPWRGLIMDRKIGRPTLHLDCDFSRPSIFGDLLSPEQTKIVDFLAAHGDSNKKRLIHDCFQRHRPADLIQSDLDFLKSRNRVTVKDVNEVPVYHAIK